MEAIHIGSVPRPEREVMKSDTIAIERNPAFLSRRDADSDVHLAVGPRYIALVRNSREAQGAEDLFVEAN